MVAETVMIAFTGAMFAYFGFYMMYLKGWKNISGARLVESAQKYRINQLTNGDEPVIVEGRATNFRRQ